MGAHSGPADWWTEGTDKGREHVATKGIVTDGLVLNLDAGVNASYPGSGTTWTDLSGNGNNGSLENGASYNSTDKSIVFDSTNEEVYSTVSGVNTTSGGYNTVDFFMYWTGGTNGFPMEFSSYRLWNNGANVLGFNTGGGDCYGIIDSSLVNNWTHVVAIFYNGSYTNNSKIYTNGINRTLSQISGSARSGTAVTQVTIGGFRANTSYSFPGKIANFRIYNRALTESEIKQNFNALRNRYGI